MKRYEEKLYNCYDLRQIFTYYEYDYTLAYSLYMYCPSQVFNLQAQWIEVFSHIVQYSTDNDCYSCNNKLLSITDQ